MSISCEFALINVTRTNRAISRSICGLSNYNTSLTMVQQVLKLRRTLFVSLSHFLYYFMREQHRDITLQDIEHLIKHIQFVSV